MLDDAVESKNAHHDISEGDESSGRAGISSSFSSALPSLQLIMQEQKPRFLGSGLISSLYLAMRLMCFVFFVMKKCTIP